MKRKVLLPILLLLSLIVSILMLFSSCFDGSETPNKGGSTPPVNQFVSSPSEGLEYEESSKGYAVLSKGSCTDSKLWIPSTHNGKPVYGVFSSAFKDDTSLTSVKFGDNITFIGGSAFKGCSNLKYVDFNFGLEEINEYSFQDCTSLTDVDIPSTVTDIGHLAFDGECYNGLYYIDNWCLRPDRLNPRSSYTLKPGTVGISSLAFLQADYSFTVDTSTSLKHIGFWAFRESGLEEITLYNSLKSIGSNAFAYCDSLSEIFIPASVTTVGEDIITVRSTKIYCESASKPSGWATFWCPPYSANVYWGANR